MLNKMKPRKKRDKIEIIRDILFEIRNNNNLVSPTILMRHSNLSFQMFEEYILDLESKGFIEKKFLSNKSKRFSFSITKKGFNFLDKFNEFSKFLEEFGF